MIKIEGSKQYLKRSSTARMAQTWFWNISKLAVDDPMTYEKAMRISENIAGSVK